MVLLCPYFQWRQVLSWDHIYTTAILLCVVFLTLFPTEQLKEALQTLGLKKILSMTFQSFLSESWMDTHGNVGEFSLLLSRCHQMDLTSGCHTVPCHCAYAQNLLTAKLQTQTRGQKHSCLVPFAGLSDCLSPLAPVTGIPRVTKAKKKGQAQLTEGAWISDCRQSQTLP